jgi:hypothetical protein
VPLIFSCVIPSYGSQPGIQSPKSRFPDSCHQNRMEIPCQKRLEPCHDRGIKRLLAGCFKLLSFSVSLKKWRARWAARGPRESPYSTEPCKRLDGSTLDSTVLAFQASDPWPFSFRQHLTLLFLRFESRPRVGARFQPDSTLEASKFCNLQNLGWLAPWDNSLVSC